MTRALDGARLALSFLTVLPVRAGRVDGATGGVAMALAPAVGVLLGGLAATVAWAATGLGCGALVTAVLAIATLAALTGGLHLDGLADTADGLGSGRPAAQALSIMRRSDIGPFGVAALVLCVLAQVAALTELISAGSATAGLVLAAATGRAAVPLACRPGVPPARPDGLGALVAGTVPLPAAGAAVAGVLAVAVLANLDSNLDSTTLDGTAALRALVGVGAGLGAAVALQRQAVRRLGGVTGDVFGALVEIGTTATLLVLATG